MFSSIDALPEKQLNRLEESWAGVFYREFFVRIDEKIFAVLYSDEPSRPNIPVNVLFGLETLKSGFGWTDEELYDAFCYHLQVRYALGYRELSQGHFELRTLYNFRRRLSSHMQETGENLVEQAFEQLTDQQLEVLNLSTKKLRMDSTLIASNIREMSRLQLLVEVVQRVHRILNASDQQRYAEAFAPYLKGSSGQYLYHLKGEEGTVHIERIGRLLQQLVEELAGSYAEDPVYQMLKRVFAEHFVVEAETLRRKQGQELSSSSLQSPDDGEASYRRKGNQEHVGYTANVTETCDPDNELQLIVKVQVEPNNTEDAAMLVEALPALKARLEVDELWSDGGFGSPQVDETMRKEGVVQIQTAIGGPKQREGRLGLDQYEWKTNVAGHPQRVTCPQGQSALVTLGSVADRYRAAFPAAECEDCPLAGSCPGKLLKRTPERVLWFSQQQVDVALRRQRSAQARAAKHNLRAAVEATVRSLKHPFGNGKVPVRGQRRVSMILIASAAMSNVRRIWRYQLAQSRIGKAEEADHKETTSTSEQPLASFFVALWTQARSLVRFQPACVFSC
jgi:hypothetical protein